MRYLPQSTFQMMLPPSRMAEFDSLERAEFKQAFDEFDKVLVLKKVWQPFTYFFVRMAVGLYLQRSCLVFWEPWGKTLQKMN